MNTITCIVVDDEPLALQLMESYVRKTPFLDLRGSFPSASTAFEFIKENQVDLLFCDIQMPGLSGMELSKMLLCQMIGLSEDENITLADEESGGSLDESRIMESGKFAATEPGVAFQNRPELKVLQNTIDLSKQTTNALKAGNLPTVLLTGGYMISNPNTFNGFEKKFGGVWNVGVVLRVPVWNWGDVKYKVRASKGATAMANLELDDAREMVSLQVRQSNFKVKEALKKLTMAQSNVANADENLRMANLAFKEGTASYTTVMEAQTAWNQAQSQKIDAEIGVKLSEVELQKALGTLE